MFLLYVRYAVALISIVGLAFILFNPAYVGPVSALMFVIASLLWFRRTVVEFGWGSVRGQLTGILGLAFVVQAIGCGLVNANGGIHIPDRSVLLFLIARLLFFTASARYTFHFLRKWHVLPPGKVRAALGATLLVVLVVAVIPGTLPRLFRPSVYTLFVLADILLLLSSFYNLFLFWGTMVMKRWVFGTAVVVLLTVGDAFLMGGLGEMTAMLTWYTAASFIALTGTIRT